MKETLEKIFDIPFVVESGIDSYPWVRVAPKGEKDQMFSIKVTNRSDVRLVISFEPQPFSAALVASMGRADDEKRAAFCDLVKLQIARGGAVSMLINGASVEPCDCSTWPKQEWRKVEYHAVVVLPEGVAGEHDLVVDKVREWGCLAMGAFLSLVRIDFVERSPTIDSNALSPQAEGDRLSVVVNKYERSVVNRFLCIARHGVTCSICGFDFKKKYGVIGDGFIHVHHIVPVSKIGPGYVVDPENDLAPVCPNCHAMLHRKDPPYMPDELRKIIEQERQAYPSFRPAYRIAAENANSYGVDA